MTALRKKIKTKLIGNTIKYASDDDKFKNLICQSDIVENHLKTEVLRKNLKYLNAYKNFLNKKNFNSYLT